MRKIIAKILIVLILLPTIGLIVWYGISFLPHLNELKQLAKEGNDRIESVADVLYPIAVAGETKEGVRRYAIRQAYWSLVFSKHRKRNLVWHLNNMLWYAAGRIHINDQEIFGIWVNCSLYGCGEGLQAAAKKYYQKEIAELSTKELAGIVAIVRNPSRFQPGTANSEKRIKEILEKAKNP